MIFDSQALFSDDQAITATAASTNTIDLGVAGTPINGSVAVKRDLGAGCAVPVMIKVTETFNNLTSIKVALQVDDNTSFSSAKTVDESPAIVLADLVKGKRLLPMYIPEGVDEQYVRLNYTVTGTAPTAGKIKAGIVAGVHTN